MGFIFSFFLQLSYLPPECHLRHSVKLLYPAKDSERFPQSGICRGNYDNSDWPAPPDNFPPWKLSRGGGWKNTRYYNKNIWNNAVCNVRRGIKKSALSSKACQTNQWENYILHQTLLLYNRSKKSVNWKYLFTIIVDTWYFLFNGTLMSKWTRQNSELRTNIRPKFGQIADVNWIKNKHCCKMWPEWRSGIIGCQPCLSREGWIYRGSARPWRLFPTIHNRTAKQDLGGTWMVFYFSLSCLETYHPAQQNYGNEWWVQTRVCWWECQDECLVVCMSGGI